MTQPGWYQDPASPFFVRWWDGLRWTNETRPGGLYPDPVADSADAADEVRAGKAAATALAVGAVAYVGGYLLNALLIGSVATAYRRWYDALSTDGQATLVLPRTAIALNLLSSIISLSLFVVGVVFLLWFHKAATVASRAGIPARRSPGWAIAGWFIPIGNLWLPYQSAVDLFPPGHPGRQLVTKWWLLWLATGLSGLLVLAGSLIATVVGLAVALVAGALALAAASAGRSVVTEVNEVHTGLVRR